MIKARFDNSKWRFVVHPLIPTTTNNIDDTTDKPAKTQSESENDTYQCIRIGYPLTDDEGEILIFQN